MFEVKLPKLSDERAESVIVFWHKSEGDVVKAGDVLVEVQTDKAVSEIEAEEEGVLTSILKKRGDVAEVGAVLAVLSSVRESGSEESQIAPGADNFVRVPPRVRKRAKELGVELGAVVGTGPRGVPTVEDVERSAGSAKTKKPKFVPFSQSRKVTAERMEKSLRESAQLTITAWANVTELKAWRDCGTEKVSWNTLCLYAAAKALKKYPEFNARVQIDGVRLFSSVNLGVAVDTEDALYVPVIKNAETLSLGELERAAKTQIQKAKEKKLSAEDYKDGTFTVTSLGGYGIKFFTPIINPPQVAILGVGAIESYLTIEYGDIVINDRLPLSLTFNHCVADGGPAARFLQSIIYELCHMNETVLQS